MKWKLSLVIGIALASPALGHFVFVVPNQKELQVIFSDTLEPDEKVAITKIQATELFAVDASGKHAPVKLQKTDHFLRGMIPNPAPILIGGATEYGVAQSKHTGDIPVLIKYYPKLVVGNLSSLGKTTLGKEIPLEIMPQVREGKLEFIALHHGKPAVDAACVIKIPDGPGKVPQMKTDAQGRLPGQFTASGRYGVWVKVIDPRPGEWKGKKYDKAHTYATLVVDYP